jgi:signal transduction histidine kinase
VDDLVGQALDEIGEHERVTVSVPADLPAVRVDAIQLQRVLVNLLDNALKFSGEGGVELRASASGNEVQIEVLDRGPGFGDAEPSTLLEPFTRAGGASGAGLGLAIASGFAEVNGVELALEPREGGGTRARLTLAAESIPAGE